MAEPGVQKVCSIKETDNFKKIGQHTFCVLLY